MLNCNLDWSKLPRTPRTPAPTTQGQDVTLLLADLHLAKYRGLDKTMWGPIKRNRRLSERQDRFILPNPAKLQGPISQGGIRSI